MGPYVLERAEDTVGGRRLSRREYLFQVQVKEDQVYVAYLSSCSRSFWKKSICE
jgi:hypothetical protein